jgi:hypothetical protein
MGGALAGSTSGYNVAIIGNPAAIPWARERIAPTARRCPPDEWVQALDDLPFEMVSLLWLLPLPHKHGICEIGSRHCGNDRVDTEM